ncbi:9959_t:CDS:2 [Entrophospora sp. SA101]|nr:9959_t:CDS:2 [Entrophospora sp. SA101]
MSIFLGHLFIISFFNASMLDRAVSTTISHLLKSPFCIHPDTGRVCVPILPETCDDFDPLSSPTVRLLIDELERAHAIHPVTKGN